VVRWCVRDLRHNKSTTNLNAKYFRCHSRPPISKDFELIEKKEGGFSARLTLFVFVLPYFCFHVKFGYTFFGFLGGHKINGILGKSTYTSVIYTQVSTNPDFPAIRPHRDAPKKLYKDSCFFSFQCTR
jgi:hypothetical protein